MDVVSILWSTKEAYHEMKVLILEVTMRDLEGDIADMRHR